MNNKTIKQGIETRRKIYDFIVAYIEKNQYAPSYNDICEGTGIKSKSTMYCHLHKLADMGVIAFKENYPRTIRVLKEFEE